MSHGSNGNIEKIGRRNKGWNDHEGRRDEKRDRSNKRGDRHDRRRRRDNDKNDWR
jgi:hypothetical protein